MKFLTLLDREFSSSSSDTPEFINFVKVFKKEITWLFKPYSSKINFSKGHFEISGFVQLLDDRIFYFSVGDIRRDKNSMLVRTAKAFKDYTGGMNNWVTLNRGELCFKEQLFSLLKLDNN